jgi:CubicO group peptidase (beta-lactamase class C family)
MKKGIIFILIIFVIAACKNNKPKYENGLRKLGTKEINTYTDSIKTFIDTLLLKNDFSGGILIAKNGQIIYEKYQGFYDAGQQKQINDSTVFHVASTSKTFTSTAVLQLIKQGKLSLTDSLEKFFPAFPYKGITIKHLLTHTSGLSNYANFMSHSKWPLTKKATNNDVLQIMVNEQPPMDHITGEKFDYCNTNFVLLALIVEKITGMSFPVYVKENIFMPCGMTSSFVFSLNDTGRYNPSFTNRGNQYFLDFLDCVYGDKNVYTNCRDLLKYDSCIRNNIVLDKKWYDTAWIAYNPDKSYRDSTEYYGLGWRLKYWPNGNKIVYHNGWWHGNNSVFQRLIQDTAVVIITGNRFTHRIYWAAHAANAFRPYYKSMNFPPDEPDTTLVAPVKSKKRKAAEKTDLQTEFKKREKQY